MTRIGLLVLIALTMLITIAFGIPEETNFRVISLEEYKDKVDGGWLGQMIGVAFGGPTEFVYRGRIMPFSLTDYTRRAVRDRSKFKPDDPSSYVLREPHGADDQDDTYIELVFLHALRTRGPYASAREIAEIWNKYVRYDRVWHANKAAQTNFRKDIWPPQSGHPDNNGHADDIDFQIEADLFGLICPGLPAASNEFSERVGHIMNYGDGVYGGMFVAGMYAAAFFESDPEKIVRYGLACIHPESKYAKVINDVLDSWEKDRDDWIKAWNLLEKKWAQDDQCPSNKGKPGNIDAKINGAYIAMGLLYGGGDFYRTLDISTRCGQDSDCNPSNAAGILGCALGATFIPMKWKQPMMDFVHNRSLLEIYPPRIKRQDIIDATAEVGIQVVVASGGYLTTEGGIKYLHIPVQEPAPPANLEQSQW
jgi:hypothetical protein